jgi:hypothetical protein
MVEISQLCCCVCFKGWVQVYYGLDLLWSKLSIAQSSGKFRERHSTNAEKQRAAEAEGLPSLAAPAHHW